jgi:energy-coupling factor transport system ATP-binding protein
MTGDGRADAPADADGERSTATAASRSAVSLEHVSFAYEQGVALPSDPNPEGTPEPESSGGGGARDPDDREGPVLRGVDLQLPTDTFTVVMGASGGGKSTLLRTFNAIIPDFIDGSFAGEVDVLGVDATDTRVSEMAERVGMVLQDYESQLFATSVATEVAFGPENLAVPPGEIDDRIDAALELVGLEALDRRREPSALSGGQKQRLVVAGVVAMHPEFLVLDEPTSDLDPKGTRDLLEVVAALTGADRDQAGTVAADAGLRPDSIAMVTHKIEEAVLADRAVLLDGGRVATQGSVREVFTDVDRLRASRVAVPPMVEAFDRLGVPRDRLPLLPGAAADLVREFDLSWVGHDADAPPAGTGTALGDPLFELEDVVYEYDTDRGPIRAVDDVDLTVREGEVLGLVGHNGSGKTTLAKHLNGLNEPDGGSVTFRGRPVADYSMAEIGREVGYVFQNPDHQIFAATVREEVAFGPENFGIEGDALEERVTGAIETVGLDGLEEADPFALSKGQRQRVALAGILATDPSVIVFDEPTTGLDAEQQDRFMDLVAQFNRESGLTVVMVTHDMEKLARYASRVAVLSDGALAYDGGVRELFADGDRLVDLDLQPPHVVDLSNRLRDTADPTDPPALSVEELVAGLGGPGAVDTDTDTDTDADADTDTGGRTHTGRADHGRDRGVSTDE